MACEGELVTPTVPKFRPHPSNSSSAPPKDYSERDGKDALDSLLRIYRMARHSLKHYKCKEAIKAYSLLPENHRESPYVLHKVGLAYFEMSDYEEAKVKLEEMHRKDRGRMEGLEILSTVYWHLKKEVELSSLAREASDRDKLSPETWCVVGNCYSLQKEHDLAIKFFQRSTQIKPSFTYGYTLTAHEYVANEDFDKAISCFRKAIKTDSNHYNAWYGLGAIYYRQEKFCLSEYHFRKALSINPSSSILHCHLGMVLHASKKFYDALKVLSTAFALSPNNPQACFQKANVLISLENYPEALESLEHVLHHAPREASVHFLIGKVQKKLGRTDEALKAFVTALDLDPKDSNMIKGRIDRLDEEEIEEDVSGF